MPTPTELATNVRSANSVNAAADAALAKSLAAAADAIQLASEVHAAKSGTTTTTFATLADQVAALPVLPTPPTPAPWVPAFPGDTLPSTIRWGACPDSSDVNITGHEAAIGKSLGVIRRFYQQTNWAKAAPAAAADLLKGRLTWVSIKPYSWADMAAGKYDAQIDTLITSLMAVSGPVWLTVHHEPEGGGSAGNAPDDAGGPTAWRGMQSRVRARLTAKGAKNIAFAPVLMSWTFDPRSSRNPEDWWVPGIWDFYGIDLYQTTESGPAPVEQDQWLHVLDFAEKHKIRLGIAELGNHGSDATAAAELRRTYEHFLTLHIAGSAYFDTSLSGGTLLTGVVRDEFRRLAALASSVTIQRS